MDRPKDGSEREWTDREVPASWGAGGFKWRGWEAGGFGGGGLWWQEPALEARAGFGGRTRTFAAPPDETSGYFITGRDEDD